MKAFRLSGRAPMASGRPRLLYDRPRISLESMPFAALSHGCQQQDTTDRRWVGRLSGLLKALKGFLRASSDRPSLAFRLALTAS